MTSTPHPPTAKQCDLGPTQLSPNPACRSAAWGGALKHTRPSALCSQAAHPFKCHLHAIPPNFETQALTGWLLAPAIGTAMRHLPRRALSPCGSGYIGGPESLAKAPLSCPPLSLL